MASDNLFKLNHTIDDEKYPEMDVFLNEEESDVVFIIDGQRVPALTGVLRLRSPVFRAVFSVHRFKVGTDKEITIKDTTVDAFKTMLRYLYTDELILKDAKDMQLIVDVLANADKYQLRRLTDVCEQLMKQIGVTIDNTIVLYGFASKYGLNELIQTLKTFIITNLDQFLAKTAEELIGLNVASDNWWLKVMTNGTNEYIKARNYLKPKIPSATSVPGNLQINGIYYDKRSDYYYNQGVSKYQKQFEFKDLSIN